MTVAPFNGRLSNNLLTELPVRYLRFDSIMIYQSPVSFRAKLDELSFVPQNRQKWGTSLQSGCRKVSRKDFNILREN
ncbi:protein of unknown function [Georgfuchsia toluolica]|uniref:Uncharacterized protein n=2 Tax=Georgfuchsia toluolica TaxID=424218 RepID=A0A916NI71_9PROT|nr:protein of unknown function [Georgfuchsia toluolica]